MSMSVAVLQLKFEAWLTQVYPDRIITFKDGKYVDSHIDLLWHNCKLFHGVMESIPISEILKGIDETEISSEDGWWETSSGAEFGKGRLDAVIRAINEAGFKAH